jgi:hypothetical protein
VSLAARLGAALSRPVDPAVSLFAARLASEAGALAVLFYGSNLRTGSREGVLDYYVLTPGEPEQGLWPTVSYREWMHEGEVLRAKIASMTMAKFAEAAAGGLVDTTIWARFVQPSALVWQRDDAAARAVVEAVLAATLTAARLAVALGPAQGPEAAYWTALFRATYQAELRVEPPGREQSILALNPTHFDGLLTDALEAAHIPFGGSGELLVPQMDVGQRHQVLARWRRSRRWGKALNVARLVRATATFDGAGRYAAWKVERHTGVKVKLTPWREKHPILAAPAVLWQVWRARRAGSRQS